ncbi:hypothetical protein T02_2053 [Trichinella nativa]|uniref:Uncharacterized protein n=1 Tax=Trichinella nativa TaxID=6335 RepID=A0A0V1KMV3_9BILA|nr:hypothetical protein T02_2053 [Trichinella nativa]
MCKCKCYIQNRLDLTGEDAYPTYVSRCLTLRAQCLTFMQIGPLRISSKANKCMEISVEIAPRLCLNR